MSIAAVNRTAGRSIVRRGKLSKVDAALVRRKFLFVLDRAQKILQFFLYMGRRKLVGSLKSAPFVTKCASSNVDHLNRSLTT